MINKIKNSKFFATIILPLFVMLLWGSLYPFVKIGYNAFNIDANSIPNIVMFAAIRFAFCGFVVCMISLAKREKMEQPIGKNVLNIVIVGFFSVVLHYALTYIGLSITDSSKTALLKQLGSLLYVCFAFLFIKDEKFSMYKIVGAIVGFLGIVAINTGGGKVSFSMGDMLLVLASLSIVASFILSRICVDTISPFWVTGISQLFGGIVLFVAAVIMGGKIPVFTIKSLLVFTYICTASIFGYTIFYYLQKTIDNSRLFIIKFAEPLFACVFGAILLGEDIFKIQYLFAFVLISGGIIIGNKRGNRK